MAGLPSFEDFRKHGFHSNNDPTEVSGPFLDLLRTIYFRAYMVFTDRTKVPGNTEIDRVEFMYVKLVSDLLIKHRKEGELLLYIEQSTGMGAIIQRLAGAASKLANATLGRVATFPQLKIEMVGKTDYMSMAIVDYVMSAVSRWQREGRTTNPKLRPYRAFREIEPFVSVLSLFQPG